MSALATDLGVDEAVAGRVVSHLVSDVVDPVQQVPHPEKRYVGVIAYREWPDAGAYGYVHYSDRFGKRRRVVCARCVEMEQLDENISHATQGEGSAPVDASWEALVDRVTAHYVASHDRGPERVEPGASLVSQSTIGGNTAWHAGNDGSGSGLSAADVAGSSPPWGAGDIADSAVGTAKLDFDTATQSELNGHVGDTTNPHGVTDDQTGAATALSNHIGDGTNPHGVTDDQTGAATALSNHESDGDAHHSKPTGTNGSGVQTTGRQEGFHSPCVELDGRNGAGGYGTFYDSGHPVYLRATEVKLTLNGNPSRLTYQDGTETSEITSDGWVSTDSSKVIAWFISTNTDAGVSGVNKVVTENHSHSI